MLGPDNIMWLDSLVSGDALPDEPGAVSAMKMLAEADVVYAVNPDNQRDILVVGREKLREIAASDVPQGARIVRVNVGSEPHRLERLLALVRQSKGYHDYTESA